MFMESWTLRIVGLLSFICECCADKSFICDWGADKGLKVRFKVLLLHNIQTQHFIFLFFFLACIMARNFGKEANSF